MKDITKININKLSISTFYDDKTRSSFCWLYFGNLIYTDGNKRKVLNPDRVYCSACLNSVKEESGDVTFGAVKVKKYNKTVSTGNLTRHLLHDHQIQDIRPSATEVLAGAKEKETRHRPSSSKSQAAKHDKTSLARNLAIWFCKSLLPFDSVSDDGMVEFFARYEMIRTKDQLPSASAVYGTALTDLYQTALMNVKEQITEDAPQYISMTMDQWSDRYRKLEYITITLHYLTNDFELKSLNLNTQILPTSRTYETIREMIIEVTRQFGLEEKPIYAVTGTERCLREAVSNINHHICLGHGLHNLVIVDGINSIPEILFLVKKCENIVRSVRYKLSEIEVEDEEDQELLYTLDKVAQLLECDENEPLNQSNTTEFSTALMADTPMPAVTLTPTRWHIVLEMLECLVNFGVHKINNIFNLDPNEFGISQREWILLGELTDYLKRFREVAEVMSLENTSTMNVALVFRSEIIDILKTVSDDASLIMRRLKSNMLANIDKRLPVTRIMIAAALLDTRFMALSEIDSYLEAHEMTRSSFLASCLKDVIVTSDAMMPAISMVDTEMSNNETPSILKKLSMKHSVAGSQMIEDPLELECWCYLASIDPTEPKDGNILSFWNTKNKTLPRLTALAKSVLSVPAISTTSERMFSTAGLLHSAKRSRLNPSRINKIIFVHEHL